MQTHGLELSYFALHVGTIPRTIICSIVSVAGQRTDTFIWRLTRDLFRQRRLGRGPGLTPAPLRKFLIVQTVRDGRYDVQSPLLVLCGPQKSPLNHSMRLSPLLARPGPRGRSPAQSLFGASAPSQIVFDFIWSAM